MSLKVLHIINGEFFAGAERVQDLLALKLPDFNFECDFICLKEGDFERFRKSTSKISLFPMRSKFDFSVSKRIIEQVKDQNYRLVHSHTPRSALIGKKIAKALNIPLVHHVHSPTLRDTDNKLKNILNAFIEDKLVLPSADHLIPVSFSLKNYLLEHGVSEDKITPVPNGVPIVSSTPAWQAPEADTWLIGTVALFRPRKGLEVLLHAIKQLKEQGLNIRLKAVGTFETKEYEASIKKLANVLKIENLIEWTGFTSNVHAEMESMHIFVLPSLFGEGLPMVVIEAMSVGIPVVSTDVEGIPDVLDHGKAGVIVPPNDSAALAKGIASYISGEQDPITTARTAHTRQAQIYSDTAMAKAVASIYHQIIAIDPNKNHNKGLKELN